MKTLLLTFLMLTSTASFAEADSRLVRRALEDVRQAQQALIMAEDALVASLQQQLPPGVITCRIVTSLYTYDATGVNRENAVSNARLKCKNSGTIPRVCDEARVETCW